MNELLTKIAHHLIADEPKDCGEQFLAGRAYGIAEMLSEIGRQSVAAKAPVGDSVDSYEFRKLLDDAISCAPGDQEYFNDALIIHITAWKDAQLASARKDAEQWRFLRDLKCNSLYLTRDEGHATNYVTSKEWIEQHCPEDFADDDPAQVQSMKDTNTIWRLQVYPNTPIGFFAWHGATPDAALDAARAHLTNTTEN